MQISLIANLETVEIKPKKLSAKTKKVVMFHGYGANMHDLVGLAQYLDPEGHCHWYFPNGPLQLPMGGFFDSRAWFAIDIQALEYAQQKGVKDYFLNRKFEGLPAVVENCLQFLQALPPGELILGGFSQGSMLIQELALRTGLDQKGLLLFSTSILNWDFWSKAIEQNKGFNVFISHGYQDPLLPFEISELLAQHYQGHDHNCMFVPFSGGHEIPMETLVKAKEFLNNLLV